jgi:ATP phosphoribosyltransferase
MPKGSLQEATFGLFKKAGFHFQVSSRSYIPTTDDPELDPILLRAQEIARYVEMGVMDCGLTGKDWILENNADVVEVADFVYGKSDFRPVRIVLAAPKGSEIHSVKDLEGKRLATEYVKLTRRWLEENGVNAQVEYSYGATEVKVPELVDAIVELTETGSSLRAHGLEIVETILESTTRLIANKDAYADPWKRQKMKTWRCFSKAHSMQADW